MPSINISSMTSYYGSATTNSFGSGTGASSAAAIADAKTSSLYPDNPSPLNNSGGTYGSNVFGSSRSGIYYSDVSSRYIASQGEYYATATSHYDGTMYQLKLNFSLSNVPAANLIASAKLKFSCSGDTSSSYAICNGGSTFFVRYNDSNIFSNAKSFTPSSANTGIDITTIFKSCIQNGQGYITILYPNDTCNRSATVTVSGTPVIEYTITYTNCGAPTSVSASDAIQKPSSTVNIIWSGAEAGNNMTIQNYTVYWKIGEAPTTSSYTGSAISTSSPYSFTVPSNATRGSTYYFKIVTNGSVSGYSSGISSAQSTVTVNSLPAAPTVTASSSRVISGGSKVTFTVTAGIDPDTGQTLKTYWATSTTGQKTEVENNSYTTPDLSSATTYYFWTYDDLEYSSSYTSKAITVNIAPSISDFNMTAIATFTPTVQNRYYVKNIKLDTPTITKDPSATLTYSWKFLTGTATSSSAPSTEQTVFGNATSYSNLDVTTGGVGFNNSYRVQLTVTDDLGESATKISTNAFCIPSAPTITVYNQLASSNVSTANTAYFGRYIRIYYNPTNNNGLTKKLQYKTSSATTWTDISLTGTEYSDVDLNALTRDTAYTFQVVFTCNSITSTTSTFTKTRAADITPQTISATPQTGTSIKPYTNSLFNISFTNQPLAFTNQNNVSTTYAEIYTISLEYGGRSLSLNSTGTDASGTVTGTCALNNKATSDWITLINGSGASAPNSTYNVSLKITAQNSFGEQFQNVATIVLDFIEGINTIGTAQLQIKTGTNSWKAIPTSYRVSSFASRYPTFETQTLRIAFSGLKIYANQVVTVYFMLGNTQLNYITISASEWTAPSTAGNYLYTLNGTKYIEYTLPACASEATRDYSVYIVLANNNNGTISGSSSNNLNTTSFHRFSPTSINFSITDASESNDNFTATWTCTDFGGSVQNTKYSNSYSSIVAQLQYCATPTGTYTDLGSSTSLSNVGTTSMSSTGTLQGATSGVNLDIVYFGAKVTVNLRFTQIDSATPTGTSTYTYYYKNQKVLYRATPNLLYGKNYFVLNATAPANGITDQILELHGTATRTTVYIGDLVKGTLTITNNGLTIDNFIINGGTWDS